MFRGEISGLNWNAVPPTNFRYLPFASFGIAAIVCLSPVSVQKAGHDRASQRHSASPMLADTAVSMMSRHKGALHDDDDHRALHGPYASASPCTRHGDT